MIKIGFIGTGNFARQHAEILQELNANIVACYGTNAEKTAAFARDFHCQIYSQPEDFISPAIIDALYIVVPPFAHDGKVELKAIQEKVPFLCEKPVGLNLSLCQEIAEQIKQTNLITSSGYLSDEGDYSTQ
jgi:myo-inositol 2-dehydrogenase / D-chiro-inositol 1-dehydrogenase